MDLTPTEGRERDRYWFVPALGLALIIAVWLGAVLTMSPGQGEFGDSNWRYSFGPNKVSARSIHSAILSSQSDCVAGGCAPGYAPQTGNLLLMPNGGAGVALFVSGGRLQCEANKPCAIDVQFDDLPSEQFAVNIYNKDSVVILDYPKFYAGIAQSSKVMIVPDHPVAGAKTPSWFFASGGLML